MSILVKGMEIPENCFECPFMLHRSFCLVNTKIEFTDEEYSELKGRYIGCPLGEVVHCKECKWYSDSQHIDHSKMCKLLGVYPAPDGYCYAGKRKEGFYER